jgi:hypothetical protein
VTGAIGLNSFGFGGGAGGLTLTVVFAVLFASVGYRISVRHQTVRGVTPWRIPSVVWAILCGIFTFFGLILELVAEYTTRPQTRPSPMPGGAQQAAPQFAYRGSAPSGTDANTLPPIEIAPGAGVFAPSFAPPPDDGSGRPALFGWYPDVTGRHQLRYWDGRGWTEHVADQGTRTTDPL